MLPVYAPDGEEPEIFDAIELGDLARLQEALKTWDVNGRYGSFGMTALYAAMSQYGAENLAVCYALLEAGADPSKGLTNCGVLNGLGFGLWDQVAAQDLSDLILYCVERGADLEEGADAKSWTPLLTALYELNTRVVEAFLMAGADPNAYTGGRGGSLDMVCDDPELTALLLKYGAFRK